MAYTVKELAKISKVSVRTLHWYDQIGLLKPAYQRANGYRYYEEVQLFRLQQILFFKELRFNLKDIQKLLLQNDFDNVKALYTHRKILEEDIARKNSLIATIDKTIQHLRGKQIMKDNEKLYQGFDNIKQKEYEQYLVKHYGILAEERLLESKKYTAKWEKNKWKDVKDQCNDIHNSLVDAINLGLKINSSEVQVIIHRHYQMIQQFYEPSKEIYIGLTDLYREHSDFKKSLDTYHPKMVEFIGQAMKFYANQNL